MHFQFSLMCHWIVFDFVMLRHCLIFKNSGLQQAGDLLLAHRLGNSLFGMDNLLILK